MAFLPFWHRTHARPTGLAEGQRLGRVVAPAHPLARRPVYVHGQTGKAYIARNTKPVPGLQAGTEGTIAGQPVGDNIGAAGGDFVLKVVKNEFQLLIHFFRMRTFLTTTENIFSL